MIDSLIFFLFCFDNFNNKGSKRGEKTKLNNAERKKIYQSLLMSSRSDATAAATTTGASSSRKPHQGGLWPTSHRSIYSNTDGGYATTGAATVMNSMGLSPRRMAAYFSNEDLNLMCPVSLHEKLAKNLYDVPECRCRKLHPPIVRDIEFDYFVRLLPQEQLAAVIVIDSQYKTFVVVVVIIIF